MIGLKAFVPITLVAVVSRTEYGRTFCHFEERNADAGKQDQPEGKLKERYGYAKDRAQKEMDDWYGRQSW